MMVMNVVQRCGDDIGGQVQSVVTHQCLVVMGLSSVHHKLSEDGQCVLPRPAVPGLYTPVLGEVKIFI
jgi:hypothetical protein